MAQFDVHENIGKLRHSIPFIVIVQSAQFDNYKRRVVVPLVHDKEIGPQRFAAFHPTFTVQGTKVVLNPLDIVSIPLDQLGAKVGSLAQASQEIMAALDELLSRAWN